MRKKLNLKRIVTILLITITFNFLKGCTSIKEEISLNSIINTNEVSNEEKNMTMNSFKLINNEEKIITLNYDEIKDSLIRFHVIANSDTEEDQNLKIKVKNEVIDYLYPYLKKSQSLDESRRILKDNMEQVRDIATKVIKNNHYNYDVNIELARENFPEKSYGNITLPQGNYEAFRIIIGSGEGKNWWCVMFPPLCFVDESKAQVEYKNTQNKILAKEKTDSEVNNLNRINEEIIENKKNYKDDINNENNKSHIKVKFKIVEIIKKMFK